MNQTGRKIAALVAAHDWASLSHAYGDAADIPELLFQLCSDSRYKNESAWDELTERLISQDWVSSATVATLPILVCVLLESKSPALQLDIIEGLCDAAEAAHKWPRLATAQDMLRELAVELTNILEIAENLGVEAIADAAFLASLIESEAELTSPFLQRWRGDAGNGRIRAAGWNAYVRLFRSKTETSEQLADCLSTETDWLVKFELIKLQFELFDAGDSASIECLVNGVRELNMTTVGDSVDCFRWSQGSVERDLLAICQPHASRFSRAQKQPIIDFVRLRLTKCLEFIAYETVSLVFDFYFGPVDWQQYYKLCPFPPSRDYADLDSAIVAILKALVNRNDVWRTGNMGVVLSSRYLPNDQAALREYLALE